MRLIPIVFAYLLLGAHFLRDGAPLLTLVCILAPLLLLVRRRWVLVLLQAGAYMGALVWLHTTILLVQSRQALGRPWGRMLLILAAVFLVTTVAGLLLNARKLKDRYPSSSSGS